MEDYSDKVVVVTGSAGGIGSALSEAFAQAGARLGLCDLRDAAATVECCGSAEVYTRVVDVGVEEQVAGFCQGVQEAFGAIDILVNTVGIVDCPGDVEGLSTAL